METKSLSVADERSRETELKSCGLEDYSKWLVQRLTRPGHLQWLWSTLGSILRCFDTVGSVTGKTFQPKQNPCHPLSVFWKRWKSKSRVESVEPRSQLKRIDVLVVVVVGCDRAYYKNKVSP